jgi:hypothetical protein
MQTLQKPVERPYILDQANLMPKLVHSCPPQFSLASTPLLKVILNNCFFGEKTRQPYLTLTSDRLKRKQDTCALSTDQRLRLSNSQVQ